MHPIDLMAAVSTVHHGLTTAQTSLIVAGISLVGIIITGFLGAVLGRWADAANRRRSQYSDAVATLSSWAEYPFRVRRRTSDDPTDLAALRDIGHDLQERMRCHQAWITTENTSVANAYKAVKAAICAAAGPALQDAWGHPPVTTAARMNLNGWGPTKPDDHLDILEYVIASRFGYDRLMPWLPKWRLGVLKKWLEARQQD